MRHCQWFIILLLVASAGAAQTVPETPQTVLDRVLTASGGQEPFGALGIVELKVKEEEIRTDGSTTASQFKAYVGTRGMNHVRMELGRGLTLVREGSSGWATMNGKLDDRPQTPRMAKASGAWRWRATVVRFRWGNATRWPSGSMHSC